MKIATRWAERPYKTRDRLCCMFILWGWQYCSMRRSERGPRFIGTSSEMDVSQMREMAAARMQRMGNTPGQGTTTTE